MGHGDGGTAHRPPGPSVAIVHDYLTQRGGAERVVLAMQRSFPGATLHTSLYDPDGTFPEVGALEVCTSPMNRLGFLRRSHRLALPLLAPSFSAMRVDADVVLCSSSGWAHGVRSDSPKVVYCYAPARWLYQTDRYLREVPGPARHLLGVLAPALRTWDRRAARSATTYLTSSRYMQRHIGEVYGIEAQVLAPPHGMDPDAPRTPVEGLDPGYVLVVSRLLAYKNVDVVVRAMDLLHDRRLVVVGRGPEADRLAAAAKPGTRFLEGLDEEELRWVYANASVLVGASHEDFGLTPLEAAAFGVPAAVLRFGGYLDTVVGSRTGLFFDELDPSAVASTIRSVLEADLDPCQIRAHAAGFAEPAFRQGLRSAVAAVLDGTPRAGSPPAAPSSAGA